MIICSEALMITDIEFKKIHTSFSRNLPLPAKDIQK